MPARKKAHPSETIPLKLTATERKLVLDNLPAQYRDCAQIVQEPTRSLSVQDRPAWCETPDLASNSGEELHTRQTTQVYSDGDGLDQYPIDDSQFLPFVEVVLTAFEAIDLAVAAELWDHAYSVYDRICKEAEPQSTAVENQQLMQSYLLGERRLE